MAFEVPGAPKWTKNESKSESKVSFRSERPPDLNFFDFGGLRLQNECKGGVRDPSGLLLWVGGPPGERISQRSLILLY